MSQCPKCNSENTYHDGTLMICPECSYEWNPATVAAAGTGANEADDTSVRDSNGNILNNGDAVTVIKDLKIKGASSGIKSGTKIKGIRLLDDAVDGHNIACKIDGIGSINLKSEFVRKA